MPPLTIAITNGLAAAPGAPESIAFRRRGSWEETQRPTRKMALGKALVVVGGGFETDSQDVES
jgi:hypothetical protein